MAETPRILITGGTGLVGRSIVKRLIAANMPVRIMSRTEGRARHPMVTALRGDIECGKDVKAAMAGCTAVIHCCGEKGDYAKMQSVNVHGTKIVFDLAAESRVNFFCHLSTVGVVGLTRHKIVDETTDCNPANLYEETKLAAEQIVRSGFSGGRVVILRPTNIFDFETLGPWLNHPIHAKVRSFIHGRENSHLVYVDDVAAAAIHCLRSDGLGAVDTFIVSSDEEPGNTVHDVQAFLASRISGAPSPTGWCAPQFIAYWLRRLRKGRGNAPQIVYSSRKIRQSGFNYPYGLANGLRDAIRCARG